MNLRVILVWVALPAAACGVAQPEPDAAVVEGGTADASVEDAGVCSASTLCARTNDGQSIPLLSGYWIEASVVGSVGGAVAAGVISLDVDGCELFRSAMVPREPHYALGLVVYEDEMDDDGNGLPDVGEYPIEPNWDGRPSMPRGAEALAGLESGNGGLPEWEAVGMSGFVELTGVSASELRGRMAIDFGAGNRVDGPFAFSFCER